MKVIEMIEAQQAKFEDGTPEWMVGEQLKDIAKSDPHCAGILEEDLQSEAMSIAKAADQIKQYADKNHGNARCFCVTPKVAEDILRKFYGLPEASGKKPDGCTGNDEGGVMDFLKGYL